MARRDRKLGVAMRREKVLAYYRAGIKSSRTIAARLLKKDGISVSHVTINEDIKHILGAYMTENQHGARLMIAEINLDLDNMLETIWPHAMKGDLRTIEMVLKISRVRSRINGLDGMQRNRQTQPAKMATDFDPEAVTRKLLPELYRGADSPEKPMVS